MSRKEVDRIINDLTICFNGSPWYGDSLIDGIEKISFNPQSGRSYHSMYQLLEHIINWRIFAIKKITKDASYEIENDWTANKNITISDWTASIQKLKDSQQTLIQLLQKIDDAFLTQIIPGRTYNYRFLILGIIQHDIYHLGQMMYKNAENKTL